MSYKFIDSKENKNYKLFKSLFSKKYRDKYKLFVIEGKKLLKEALNEAIKIEYLVCSESFFKEFDTNIFSDKEVKISVLSDSLFNSLTEMTNSEGVVTIVNYIDEKKVLTENIILLDEINDPGNFGTIVRTANAFGIKDILTLNCVDKYNPKVLRASMGAMFRTNISKVSIDELKAFKDRGYKIISTTLNEKSKNLESFSFLGKNIIVMGNEANGVSSEIFKISDEFLKIDMENSMESLNVSVATSIIMYKIFKN